MFLFCYLLSVFASKAIVKNLGLILFILINSLITSKSNELPPAESGPPVIIPQWTFTIAPNQIKGRVGKSEWPKRKLRERLERDPHASSPSQNRP